MVSNVCPKVNKSRSQSRWNILKLKKYLPYELWWENEPSIRVRTDTKGCKIIREDAKENYNTDYGLILI